MAEEQPSAQRRRNIWAPWRMEYINGLDKPVPPASLEAAGAPDRRKAAHGGKQVVGKQASRNAGGKKPSVNAAEPAEHASPAGRQECFLCRYRDEKRDAENLVLWRGRRCFTLLNRYPYTGGHSMVAPFAHAASLEELDPAALAEIMQHVRDVQLVLRHALRAEGVNVGINIGRCAGAGLPGHLHVHVVPRWSGDTNFMAVLGDVRMIPTSLADLYEQMTRAARDLHLPAICNNDVCPKQNATDTHSKRRQATVRTTTKKRRRGAKS